MLICASVLNIITGIILSVSKFYKYDEISNDHKNSAIMYTNIENNIRLQLSLSRKDRIDPIKYLDYLNHEFSEISKISPFVNLENFEKKEEVCELGGGGGNVEIGAGILKYELDRFNSKKIL